MCCYVNSSVKLYFTIVRLEEENVAYFGKNFRF